MRKPLLIEKADTTRGNGDDLKTTYGGWVQRSATYHKNKHIDGFGRLSRKTILMESDVRKEQLIPLRFATIANCRDDRALLVCLNCDETLDVHQPDSELPDRLLAT